MAPMTADVYYALRRTGIEEERAKAAAAAACVPLEARLHDLARRIQGLETQLEAQHEEVEFRLAELETGLSLLTRPSWPF